MALDGFGVICKYIICIFNVLFALLGIAFLGLGLWLRFSPNTREIFEIDGLNNSVFVIGVTVLMVLGTVMLITVSFGDIGACSEKLWALQVFVFFLSFLTMMEISLGIISYVLREKTGKYVGEFYADLYGLYILSKDPGITATLTFVHNALHCCGVTGIPILDFAKKTCPKPDGFLEKIVMPNCPGIILNLFESKASLMLGLFLGFGGTMIAAIVCGCILGKQIKERRQNIPFSPTVY